MKNAFLFLLIIPMMLTASLKESFFIHLEDHILHNEPVKARGVLDTWENEFPEDSPSINIVRAFLLLQEENVHDALLIFENNIDALEETHPYASLISRVFFNCIENNFYHVDINNRLEDNTSILLCKRGWKIKAVAGCVLIGVGAIVTPFAPSAGVTMITSGVGMVADGTIGAIEDDDERKEKEKRDDREFQPVLYYQPPQQKGLDDIWCSNYIFYTSLANRAPTVQRC